MQSLIRTCLFHSSPVERIVAEMGISGLMRSDPDSFLNLTCDLFCDSAQDSKIRHLSALLFKNCAISILNEGKLIPSKDEFNLKFIEALSDDSSEILKLYNPSENHVINDCVETLLLYFIQDHGASFNVTLSQCSIVPLVNKIIHGCSNDEDFNLVTICVLQCIENIEAEFTEELAANVVKECTNGLNLLANKNTMKNLTQWLSICKVILQSIIRNNRVLNTQLESINSVVYLMISKGNNKVKAIAIEIWISVLHYFFENQDDLNGFTIIKCFPDMLRISIGLFEYLSVSETQDLTLLSSCSNLLFWIIQLIDDGMAVQVMKMIKNYLAESSPDSIKVGLLILHSTLQAFK